MRPFQLEVLKGSSEFLLGVLVRWCRCRRDVSRNRREWMSSSVDFDELRRRRSTTEGLIHSIRNSEQFFAFPGASISDRALDTAAKRLFPGGIDGHDHRRGSYSAACAFGIPSDTIGKIFGWGSGAHALYYRQFASTASCALFHAHRKPPAERPLAALFDGKTFTFST